MKVDGTAVRLSFVLGELEQAQRAVDVHLVRGHRRELGARREQRSQMQDQVDLELREHPLEEGRIGDRTGEFAGDELAERRIERRDVDGDDRSAGSSQPAD